jgi:hypothetical protein
MSPAPTDRDRFRAEVQRRLPPAHRDLTDADLQLLATVPHATVTWWRQPGVEVVPWQRGAAARPVPGTRLHSTTPTWPDAACREPGDQLAVSVRAPVSAAGVGWQVAFIAGTAQGAGGHQELLRNDFGQPLTVDQWPGIVAAWKA